MVPQDLIPWLRVITVLGDPSARANVEAILSDAGFNGETYHLYTRHGLTPDHVIMRSGDTVHVVIRGLQVFQQVAGVAVAYGHGAVEWQGWEVSPCFLNNALDIMDNLGSLGLFDVPMYYLHAHSQGGAAAVIMAAEIRRRLKTGTILLDTFGAPKPGLASLASGLQDVQMRRFVNFGDTVPYIPPPQGFLLGLIPGFPNMGLGYLQPWQHASPPMSLSAGEDRIANIDSLRASQAADQAMINLLDGTFTDFGPQHWASTYLSKVESQKQSPVAVGAVLSAPTPIAPITEVVSVNVHLPAKDLPEVITIHGVATLHWMGEQIAVGDTRARMKTLRKRLISFLRVAQGEAGVSPDGIQQAFAAYFQQAANQGGGFLPPLTVI